MYSISLDARHGYIMGPKNYSETIKTVHGISRDFRNVLEVTQTFISWGDQDGNAKEIDVMLCSSLP